MKTLFSVASLLLLLSCKKEQPLHQTAQKPEQFGKEIFENKGNCAACHQVSQKIVGPSILEIAQTYKKKNGDIVSFLKGNELKAIEAYIYSNMK